MAYNKDTNWENEKKYLDNLSKTGNAGQKAWAENQKKELASAQAKYSSTSSNTSNSPSNSNNTNNSPVSSGSSNKNSQYSAPSLGNTWNANTDYQAIINNAVNSGDYVTAAKAEQLRNQKIAATGGNYKPTNNYSGWLNNTDYSTQMWDGMANGMSAQDMQALYNARYKKASETIGMEDYVDDNLMQIAQNYINQQLALEQQQAMLDQWEEDNPKEDYQGKYDPRIDAILNEILNRDDFSYNAMNDPLYQQYADMYRREGDRAMKETMAEAAAGAGGMNTYAITAAQQANSYYNSQLNDKIPELYQLAYNMYLNDKESKVQDLGILQDMDATQYNRYRDTINDWYNDKNFAYNAYQNAINQGNWQTNHNYNAKWDNINYDTEQAWKNKEWNYNDLWTNKEWDEKQSDKEYERNLYDQEKAYNQIIDWISKGVTSFSDEELAKAGIDRTKVNQMISYHQSQQAKSNSSYVPKTKEEKEEEKKEDDDTGYTPKTKEEEEETDDSSKWDAFENRESIEEDCKSLFMTQGKEAVLSYLKRLLEEGGIDIFSYMNLLNKYSRNGNQ